jgi:multidrug resistance efflux pump
MNALISHPPAKDGMLTAVGEPPPPPRKSVLRRLRPLVLAAALAGAGLGGSWWWTTARFLQSTDNAAVAGDIAVLSSRIEGDVAEILLGDNLRVAAGQPLIRLDDRDWEARLAEAEAGRAETEAAITTLDRTGEPAARPDRRRRCAGRLRRGGARAGRDRRAARE